jgi:hypothetical protein
MRRPLQEARLQRRSSSRVAGLLRTATQGE